VFPTEAESYAVSESVSDQLLELDDRERSSERSA
jgi:hypothetical protein